MTKRESLAPKAKVAPHPRLFAGPDALARPARRPRLRFLKRCADRVAAEADEFLASPACAPLRDVHNTHLHRAREAQKRIVTLLVRWFQTGDERLREAAVGCVREMAGWEYWSWMTWRISDPRPDAIFDLSYGENSATLAFAFDWLHDTLSDAERELFVSTARDRSLVPFLAHTKEPRWPYWYCLPHSNWNAVCAGGAGLLALAMYDELPEARRALPRVEKSIDVFMRGLQETGGGWTEGVGYWGYGMRYAFLYLLSHERATGRSHPLLELPETKITVGFPTDFSPNGVACGFGDSNLWRPQPEHYAAAQRVGRADVLRELEDRMSADGSSNGGWPNAALWLLVHPGHRAPAVRAERNVAKLYDKMDWGILADRMPTPRVYLSVRGGTTKVHHGHLDLLSYHCVVGDEALVPNLGVGEYLDTTFSPRREDIFEIAPASKNVILINGVGIAHGSSVASKLVRGRGLSGIRIDATEAMGLSRDDEPAARFCGRLFLMLGGRAFLIVDRVVLPHDRPGRVARAHLRVRCDAGRRRGADRRAPEHADRLRLQRPGQAAHGPHRAHDARQVGQRPALVYRRLHEDVIMATLLSPGDAAAQVRIEPAGRGFAVNIAAGSLKRRVALTDRLGLRR